MDVVSCPGCGEENPARFRLCGFCGATLALPENVTCGSCGEENPRRFRLCGFCGAPLHGAAGEGQAGASTPTPTQSPPGASPLGGPAAGITRPATAPPAAPLGASEVRKPATFIFVDLKGSTALTERIDQE